MNTDDFVGLPETLVLEGDDGIDYFAALRQKIGLEVRKDHSDRGDFAETFLRRNRALVIRALKSLSVEEIERNNNRCRLDRVLARVPDEEATRGSTMAEVLVLARRDDPDYDGPKMSSAFDSMEEILGIGAWFLLLLPLSVFKKCQAAVDLILRLRLEESQKIAEDMRLHMDRLRPIFEEHEGITAAEAERILQEQIEQTLQSLAGASDDV